MKITFFSESLRIGGTERVLVLLANALSQRGYQVDVIILERLNCNHSRLKSSINVIYLDCRDRLRSSILPLAKYLFTHRPDVILPMSSYWAIPVYLAKLLVGSNVRIIPAIHFEVLEMNALPPAETSINRFLRRLVLRKVSNLVTVSRGNAAYMIKHFNLRPDRVHVINNPAVSEDIISQAEETVDHPWLSPSRDVPVILSVGRLSREKDYSTLLRAVHRVLHNRPVRMFFVGDGVERESLIVQTRELGIEQAVHFAGAAVNPYMYMRNSDMLVVSSRYESFGLVLVEAMACGTPVVSTICGTGPADILDNGSYGRLVPIGDDEALAKAMLATLSEQPNRSRLRQRAQQFSVDVAVDQYLSLFEKSIQGKSHALQGSA